MAQFNIRLDITVTVRFILHSMTVGQLSRLVNLPPKTIRFYEQIRLIPPPKRTENGYRSYSPEVIDDLKMIKSARDLGLPIPEIKKLMHGCQDGRCRHNQNYLHNEIASYTGLLAEKITQLSRLKDQLTALNRLLDDPGFCPAGTRRCCNILHQLTQISKGGETV